MDQGLRHTWWIVGLTAALATLSACNVGSGGGGGGGEASSGPVVHDASGRWCFNDPRQGRLANMITMFTDGIRASPVARAGAEEIYRTAGPNIYTNARGSAYEFFSSSEGVWRGNGSVLPLTRCQ